jgi:hypothetical protein
MKITKKNKIESSSDSGWNIKAKLKFYLKKTKNFFLEIKTV